MKLSDIPDSKGNRYPEPITFRVKTDTKNKLDLIKRRYHKDTAEIMRMLVDRFLEENEDEIASAE